MEEGKTGATEELPTVYENVGYIEKLCFTTCLDGNFIPGAVGTVRSIRKWYGKDQADIAVFLDKPEPNFDDFCRLNDVEAHDGNRLTALNAGSAPTTYGYNPANALILSVTGTTQPNTISYDPAGNRATQNVGGSLTTYTWDYENRDSLLAPPSGSPLTNTYDATGLRCFDGVDSYIWDEQNVLQTRNASGGAKVSQNTDFPGYWGNLISQYNVALGGSLWYSNDISGNTRVVTNNSGVTTATYDYQAFGTSQKVTGDTNISSRFGGQYGYFQPVTPSPILYVRQRWYDPATAQWLGRDPLDFDGGDPNLYRYVGNNPVTGIDPSGLFGIDNIYKWIWTGDCNASDEAYQGALDTAVDVGGCELDCTARVSGDALGIGAPSTWLVLGGPPKVVKISGTIIAKFGLKAAGSSDWSSWARILTNKLLEFLKSRGYSLAESKAIADKIGVRILANFLNKYRSVMNVKTSLVVALYIEAAISAYCSFIVCKDQT